MLHDQVAHVIEYRIGVPDRLAQQPLHRRRVRQTRVLGQVPAVLALDPREQPEQEQPAVRRGSTRRNRPAIAAATWSNNACQAAGSTLWPTATA